MLVKPARGRGTRSSSPAGLSANATARIVVPWSWLAWHTRIMERTMLGDRRETSVPIPSGNPGCRCATHALPGSAAVELKFAAVTLSVFEDCPDHGDLVKKIMRDTLRSLSVKVSQSEQWQQVSQPAAAQ